MTADASDPSAAPDGDADRPHRVTEAGVLEVSAVAAIAWRVGFAPDPFAWTPWEFAADGAL